MRASRATASALIEREFFIDNLLVRIHYIIVMIKWTGLAPPRLEAGSYLRLIDSCITQLKAQGLSRTCNESKEEEEDEHVRASCATASALKV